MAETLFEETRRYILDRMRATLREGGRKLPTEKELAKEVLASYATIRLVMTGLENEGFIRKIRGSGTYLQPEAEELLESASMPRLRLFTSPIAGVPDSDYAACLVAELTKCAKEKHYRVVHKQVPSHDVFLAELAKEADLCDPVVYLPPTEAFTLRQLGELGRFDRRPLVVIDCEFGNINVNNITTDNRKGGMLAARALLDCGCRNLVLIQCEPPLRQSLQRIQGFCEIAELAGAAVETWDCGVGPNDNRMEFTRRKVLACLRAGCRPDGIFAISDSGAIATAETLSRFGFEPGRDVALVGFDGLPATRKHVPSLGSIAQPIAGICDEVFELLAHWRPGMHIQKLLAPKLQPGETLASNRTCRPGLTLMKRETILA